jgi:tetratricopeptide (TPR) repeat protein
MINHTSALQSAKRFIYFLPIPGVVAVATYLFTLSHGVYPGLSAALTAEALGVIPPSEAAHPIFSLVARAVASLGLFSLPVRLNLLSAFCGTLCAMLLYHLVSKLILFSACEDAGGSEVERDDEVFELPAEVAAYNKQMFPIALTGGLVAAFIFIFMVPSWSAAIRLDNGLFDLLLALAALNLFPWADTPYRFFRLACSASLFVLGLFDSGIFLLLLPCYAFFMIRAFLSSENRATILGVGLAAGLVGSMFAVYAYAQNSEANHGETLLSHLISYSRALSASHYSELRSLFPHSGCLLLLTQVGVPVLVLLFGKSILFKEKQIRTVVALLLFMGVAVPGLLNLPIAPFFIFQSSSYLPVFEAAILAAFTAMVLTAFMVFLQPDEVLQESLESMEDLEVKPSRIPLVLRGIVGLLLPMLVLLVMVVPLLSFHEADTRCSRFADETARAMLDQMKGRSWLVSNGYLDNHLLIQAAMRKQPLTLVTLRPQIQVKETARLRRLIADSPDFELQNRQRLQSVLSLGTVRFVREWFMTDPEAGSRAMVFDKPDLWTSCGYVAVPEGLAFGGVRSGQKPGVTNLVEANRVFIGRIVPLLMKEGSGYVAELSESLRIKIGFAANELGVLLEEQGQADAAYQAYSQASQVDPANISAVVNGYVLASAQKMNSKEISRLSKKIKELTAEHNCQGQEITGILQNYGTIRQQAFYQQQAKMWSSMGVRSVNTNKIQKALALSEHTGAEVLVETASIYVQSGDTLKAEACYVAALEKDPVNQAALSAMCLLTLSQNKTAETRKWVQRALDAEVKKDTVLYPIISLAILDKDNARALRLLEEATQKFPADLRYWTLKAEVLLGQGDLLMVEKVVLPKMQIALENPDHFLVHAVRGFLLKKKGADYFEEARLSLLRALSINAARLDLWSIIFELDLAMGKPEFTEADARNLLNIEPDHALANYLMGSLLLSCGKLQEAEDFLRRSIEKNPTAAACNDLGENLRLQQKLAEAEAFARRALVIEPGLLLAMDTLASVLYDAKKYEEVAQLVVKAVAPHPGHLVFQRTLLHIQEKQGGYAGTQEQLKVLVALQTAIPLGSPERD